MRELECVEGDGQVNCSQAPGIVRLILSGAAPDLIKVVLFFDRVTAGDSPADVLRVLHLSAIRITSESGRNHRVTLVLQLEEAGR
jgi:hypothetical protein